MTHTEETQATHPEHASHTHAKIHLKNLGVPIAIIVSALVITSAILYTNGTFSFAKKDSLPNFAGTAATKITPVDAQDHILGNPNAPVVIVEYSDFSCPYCQVFHASMNQLMKDHGADGGVAWVYRHFPVITADSPKFALASECVAELGGNDAFWKFAQTIFDREAGTHADIKKLDGYIATTGINRTAYDTCMANNTHETRVQALMQNASDLGVGGTPHSFVLVNGKVREINGALPYAQLTQELSKIIEEVR